MKDQIIQYLLAVGFEQHDDVFINTLKKQTGEIFINGHRSPQVQTIKFEVHYVGDGWIGNSEEDSTLLTQWKIVINGNDNGDILVDNLEEFKKII